MTKTITIRDEVYRKLVSIKREDESFSELFERLIEKVNSREILARLRGRVEFRDKEKMLSKISNSRAEFFLLYLVSLSVFLCLVFLF